MPDSVKPISVNLSDSLGFFKTTIPHPGQYRLTIEGADSQKAAVRDFVITDEQSSIDLGDITLGLAVHELKEFTISTQRPLAVRKIDRIVYDVQSDPEVATLSTRDMLRNVPLISVDEDGTILVRGSSNFQIYKNGRPNKSYSKKMPRHYLPPFLHPL